jgi:hypothetical protein
MTKSVHPHGHINLIYFHPIAYTNFAVAVGCARYLESIISSFCIMNRDSLAEGIARYETCLWKVAHERALLNVSNVEQTCDLLLLLKASRHCLLWSESEKEQRVMSLNFRTNSLDCIINCSFSLSARRNQNGKAQDFSCKLCGLQFSVLSHGAVAGLWLTCSNGETRLSE